MSSEERRRTFISYSRINKEFALKLALELRSSGFDVWLDQLDIHTGARWDDEVERALKDCEIFMVILTPASSASDNVKDEIGYAIDTSKYILPILLENADVPLRLRRFQYVDFTDKSYDEGVESAKQLLRKLVEKPTSPLVQPSGELQPRVNTQRKAEEPAQSVPPVKAPISGQPAKKVLSMPLMIGLGVGMIAILALGALIMPRLFMQPDPSGEIPISGDSACPADSSEPVEVTVQNSTALTFDYYWIDVDCQEKHGTLNAKESATLNGFVSYVWQFYDNQNDELFFEYVADGEDYVEISGESSVAGVTGLTVGYVSYDGGEFNQTEDYEWVEKSFIYDEEHYFEEEDRDDWSVYLYDPDRDISIQLDLWTREILDTTGEEPYFLYTIATVDE